MERRAVSQRQAILFWSRRGDTRHTDAGHIILLE